MMDDRLWLVGVAILAPLTAAFSLSSLLAFHWHRHRWRTLDIFLATLAVQELLVAVLYFGRAVALLATAGGSITSTSGGGATCPLLMWASLALRTFQLTTLTSAVLDRAFALRWPYRYRLSVRRSQVRYHIAMLAVVSILVGVASTFAIREPATSDWMTDPEVDDTTDIDEQDQDETCFLLPMLLDKKFVAFVVFLHGLLTLASIVGAIHVSLKLILAGRRANRGGASSMSASAFHSMSPSSLRVDHVRLPQPISPSASGIAVTFQHQLHPHYQHNHHHHHHHHHHGITQPQSTMQCLSWSSPILRASCSSLRRSGTSSTSSAVQARLIRRDFRWKTVSFVVVVCNLINHLPYLVMVVVGRWFDSVFQIPPAYMDGASTYLALLEGLLLPVLFWAVDPVYRSAVTNSFIRLSRTGKYSTSTYFGSDRLDADNISGIESLSCSTLQRRRGDDGLLPPSSVMSTYSTNNGFACINNSGGNGTLDKKVMLTDIIGPRRWTSLDKFDMSPSTTITVKDLLDDVAGRVTPLTILTNGKVANVQTIATYDDDNMMKFVTSKGNIEDDNERGEHQNQEHIYATLVNRLSIASGNDMAKDSNNAATADEALAGNATTDEDEPEMDRMAKIDNANVNVVDDDEFDKDDYDCTSFTTSASDDFEFHLTRPTCPSPHNATGQTKFQSQPSPLPFISLYPLNSPARTNPQFAARASRGYDVTSSRQLIQDFVWDGTMLNTRHSLASSSSVSSSSVSSSPRLCRTKTKSMKPRKLKELGQPSVEHCWTNKYLRSLSKNRKRASLSMNDLDLLESPDEGLKDDRCGQTTTEEEEIVYVLAGKSESNITLYRFNHNDDADDCDNAEHKDSNGKGHTLDKPLLRRSSSTSQGQNEKIKCKPHGHHHHSENNVSNNNYNSCSRSFSPKRRHYLRNPLLVRPRFISNCTRPPSAAWDVGVYGNNNNWKYLPSVLPRQDFPWRKSPTQPFQAPQLLLSPTNMSTYTTIEVNCDPKTPVPSYRKTFISEFL